MGKTVHYLAAALALALAAALGPAWASDVVENGVSPAESVRSCQLPETAKNSNPVSDRAAVLEAYKGMPAHCLKAIVIVCSEAANMGVLDLGHAAACSIGYEALLKSGFGGDFQALVRWWQKQRGASGVVGN